jgi:hypothetical protein
MLAGFFFLAAGCFAAEFNEDEFEIDFEGDPAVEGPAAAGQDAGAEQDDVFEAQQPEKQGAAAVTPAPTPTAAKKQNKDEDLEDVSFEAGSEDADGEGLVIIAPGAASPEDSLAVFGIESPFDTRRERPGIGSPRTAPFGGEEGTGEAIELGSPDTTDFSEDLSLETASGGSPQGGLEDYIRVERAGGILTESEIRIDGTVHREKNNSDFATLGKTVYLKMAEGRQVYPGTEYVVFKETGLVQPDKEKPVIGMKIENMGVLRILRVDSEWVMSRVVQVYDTIEPGDKIRLRDPERQRYLTSLRADRNRLPADLEGKVASIQGIKAMAVQNDIVHLDFGRADGCVPGLRFGVYRDVESAGATNADRIDPVGRIGLLEVISTRLKTSTARVVNIGTPVRVGDRIRYR